MITLILKWLKQFWNKSDFQDMHDILMVWMSDFSMTVLLPCISNMIKTLLDCYLGISMVKRGLVKAGLDLATILKDVKFSNSSIITQDCPWLELDYNVDYHYLWYGHRQSIVTDTDISLAVMQPWFNHGHARYGSGHKCSGQNECHLWKVLPVTTVC